MVVQAKGGCQYILYLDDPRIIGATISGELAATLLERNAVQFRMNSDGEIDSILDFNEDDTTWARNIKRGILSAFQLKAIQDLRSIEGQDKKSAVVYETDVLGRCRTTVSTKDDVNSAEINLNKKKSLSRCTLNENSKTSAVQYQPYKNLPVS